MESDKIFCGDCLVGLKKLPDESVDCVVTSPPYWALRDYGVVGQLGLESTFDEYIGKLCDVFDEVRRVLKKAGTCWVVIGDTYSAKPVGNFTGGGKEFAGRNMTGIKTSGKIDKTTCGIKDKCLVGIPFRFALEMINRGWILRNTLIWHKPNCMPCSVKDRFTVDFEYVFFFVKSRKYFFEQQFEDFRSNEHDKSRMSRARTEYGGKWANESGGAIKNQRAFVAGNSQGRNMRAVWTIKPKPFADAHFAVYPEKLIEPMIKAGCPIGGTVLDPFFGAGTTGVVALKQGKHYLGFELNPDYIKIAEKRLKQLLEHRGLM